MKFAFCFVVSTIIIFSTPARADSPLTSIEFHRHYNDPEIVVVGNRTLINSQQAKWLLFSRIPLEKKIAFITKLGWNNRHGKRNTRALIAALIIKFPVEIKGLTVDILSAEDLAIYAWMSAVMDYQKLSAINPKAVGISGMTPDAVAKEAVKKAPNDFAVGLIAALIEGQKVMSRDFCGVYRPVQKLMILIPSSKRNMKNAAVIEMMRYIHLYRKYCPEFKKYDPYKKWNNVKAIIPYGSELALITEAGVVIRPPSGKPRKFSKNLIRSGFVRKNALYIYRLGRVEVYNGKWKTLSMKEIATNKRHCVVWRGVKRCRTFNELNNKRSYGDNCGFYEDTAGKFFLFAAKRRWEFYEKKNLFVEIREMEDSKIRRIIKNALGLWRLSLNSLTLEEANGNTTCFGCSSNRRGLGDSRVYSFFNFFILPGDDIFVTTWMDLYRLDAKQNIFKKAPHAPPKTRVVGKDPRTGRLWFATSGPVVYFLDKNRSKTEMYLTDAENINDIHITKNSNVFLATDIGLVKIKCTGNTCRDEVFKTK
ncbi:hypothetical protein KKF34_02565 [Myxococcota bacterium]|nr:hypothetical protein [Myxococcota bacterium]MBU1380937.1 hypothetical protein [Myxococcota bacterium]MBU1495746.1 hypothetical protein [Myxococcota bacterium]